MVDAWPSRANSITMLFMSNTISLQMVTFHLRSDILAELNRAAGESGEARSDFIRRALIPELAHQSRSLDPSVRKRAA